MNKQIKFRAWDGSKMNYNIERSGQFGFYLHNFKCMQYTGLIDRYETEIYEGDILARAGYSPCEIWREDGGYLIGIREKNDHHFYQNIAGQCEVIGNIYENPTLIK